MGDVGGDVEMEAAPGREEEEEAGDAAEDGRVRRLQERSCVHSTQGIAQKPAPAQVERP